MSEHKLILASASPRRRELLERVGIELEIEPANTDETARSGEAGADYARRVAAEKADAVAAAFPERWVLAADTIVEVDGEILGKAADDTAARAMLERLSARSHRVMTAFALVGPAGRECVECIATEVTMRAIDSTELDDYIAAGEWRGKAGAYAIQGMAAAFVSAVHGSVTNVIGLPLAEVLVVLETAGAARPSYRRGAGDSQA